MRLCDLETVQKVSIVNSGHVQVDETEAENHIAGKLFNGLLRRGANDNGLNLEPVTQYNVYRHTKEFVIIYDDDGR